MENNNQIWLYPLIIVAGALQAWGPPMNGALQKSLSNPWLASVVSFLPVLALLTCVFLCLPRPLPSGEGVMTMPWWAPLGGLIGSVAVIVGLMFVQKVGAGTLAGLTITANIIMSLFIDKYGMFGIQQHPLSLGRMAGGALMVAGIYLISKF
ncbi:DMT family transporter [Mucilaginibacter achroorhodeus]|uniref:DMT family transporter n=1 Tax=Mucilaginibacter achroorhodeus TaxID=2599294 RepID=A0A563UB22_9SPHI|nr:MULTISPECIES: DMT family transporter [Mucilaginibacter]QXV66329.1 DMT family transporter [Mucilaginibacter sp. 21P]TWR28550.1 DMT family transporter [Mucilaginibacter achroorhodeus]